MKMDIQDLYWENKEPFIMDVNGCLQEKFRQIFARTSIGTADQALGQADGLGDF